MLTVLVSGKAAPGVTTSAWALALMWPGPVLVADCDPAGGDMAAGYLPGRVSAERGLLSWATAARRGVPAMAAATMFSDHVVGMPENPNVWLMAGFATATQGASFTPEAWERLALALERSAASVGRDALVDAGRLVGERACWPVLRAADQVLLTVRPSVRSVHAAQGAAMLLRTELGDLARVSALIVGDGPYSAAEVAESLGVPLCGTLPQDAHTARVLSDGASLRPKALNRSSLLKAAATVTTRLTTGLTTGTSAARPDSSWADAAQSEHARPGVIR
jgi:hypothetical protein